MANKVMNEVAKEVAVTMIGAYAPILAGGVVSAYRKAEERRKERECAALRRQEEMEKLLQETRDTLRTVQGKIDSPKRTGRTVISERVVQSPKKTAVDKLAAVEEQIQALQKESERLLKEIEEANYLTKI